MVGGGYVLVLVGVCGGRMVLFIVVLMIHDNGDIYHHYRYGGGGGGGGGGGVGERGVVHGLRGCSRSNKPNYYLLVTCREK